MERMRLRKGWLSRVFSGFQRVRKPLFLSSKVIKTNDGFQPRGNWQGRRDISARDEIERAIQNMKRTELDNWFHRHWYSERDSLIRLMQGKRVLKREASSDRQGRSWRGKGVSRR